MAQRIPHIMFTAVDRITGEESEPLLYTPTKDDDKIIEHTISAIRFYRIDTEAAAANYPEEAKSIAVRLNFANAATTTAFRSGLYGAFQFAAGHTSAFRTMMENRVVRFTSFSLPIAAPGTNHDDFLVEGNFDIPDAIVGDSLSGVTLKLATPLFTDKVKHDLSADPAEDPMTFSWTLPRIPNVDHYVLYSLGTDEYFHEVDIVTKPLYKIGEDENFSELFQLVSEEGRRYTGGLFPFKTTDNYPGQVAFYKQRKIFASTNNNPDTIWFSEIGNYNNFITDVGDSDPIQVTLAANKVEKIHHIVPFDNLFFLTEGGVWSINKDFKITPGDISIDKISYQNNSESIEPYPLDGNIVFGSYCRNNLEQLIYSFNENSFNTINIAQLVQHLTDRIIRFMDIYQGPVPVVGCVLHGGDLLIGSIKKTDNIYAWNIWEHATSRVVDIVSAPNNDGFFIIARDTDDTYHLEQIRLTTCSPPGMVSPYTPVFQDNSTNYTFELESVPLENQQLLGIADRTSVSDVFIKVNDTHGLSCGIGTANQDVSFDSAFSGTVRVRVDDDWDRDSKLVITETSDNPLEILSFQISGRIAEEKVRNEVAEQFNVPYNSPSNVEDVGTTSPQPSSRGHRRDLGGFTSGAARGTNSVRRPQRRGRRGY